MQYVKVPNVRHMQIFINNNLTINKMVLIEHKIIHYNICIYQF